MKKKFVSIISLLACLALVTGCGEEESSSVPASIDNNSGNNYGDISGTDIYSSDNNGDSSQNVSDNEVDQAIASFIDGISAVVPSVADYNLEYEVIYYLAYEQYVFNAVGTAGSADAEHAYAALFTEDTGFTTMNDDEDYPVEDYGYLFMDSTQNILVNFFTESSSFYLTIYRYDGLAGTYDVSDVDTSWYVDYVNFNGLEIVDEFPTSLILNELAISEDVTIPSIEADLYVVGFEPSYTDADGYLVPDTFYVVLHEGQHYE